MDTQREIEDKKKVYEILSSESDFITETFYDDQDENEIYAKLTNLLGNYSEQTGAFFG